jgi:serine protease Do
MTPRSGFTSAPMTGALVLVALAATSGVARAQRAPMPPAPPAAPNAPAAPRVPRVPIVLPGASGWVGVSLIQTGHGDDPDAMRMEYPVVASVEPGSPAQAAGLAAGDTVLSYNNVDAHEDPLAVQRFLRPGQRLVIRYRRGEVRSAALTVANRPPRSRMRVSVNTEEVSAIPMPIIMPMRALRDAPLAGAQLAELNAGLASVLNVRDQGVLVVDVMPGSPAMTSGLEPGDVIVRADSIAVVSPVALIRAMRMASDHSVLIDLLRKGKTQRVTLRW